LENKAVTYHFPDTCTNSLCSLFRYDQRQLLAGWKNKTMYYNGKAKPKILMREIMLSVNKKIVTDEAMHPVAVLIDYQDWLLIEEILKVYQAPPETSFDLNQYAGVIKLAQDPLEYQQQIRDE
jgi:hypothetical protein